MHLALAEEAHLAHLRPGLDDERRVLLDDLGERARQAHVVLAVLDLERRRHRPAPAARPRRRPRAAPCRSAKQSPVRDALQPAEADASRRPRLGLRRPGSCRPTRVTQAGDARLRAARADHRVALLEGAAQDARERELAAVGGVQRLHHLGERRARLRRRRGARASRRAPGASWRSAFSSRVTPLPRSAEPNSTGTTWPLAQFAGEVVEDAVARRLDLGDQLLHQLVVVVGEALQHGEARLASRAAARRPAGRTTSLGACSR